MRCILDKKAVVRQYAKSHKYFTLDEIVKESNLSKQVAVNYLQALKNEGIVFFAGHGIYSYLTKEFNIPKNNRVSKIRQILEKEFPELDFIIWNTLYFQGYYHHTQTHHITFIEVEKDAISPVVDQIKRSYRNVIVEKKGRIFNSDFDITRDPIMVRGLINRSPRDGHNPRLEKILVDLFVIKDKYRTMADTDYWELWKEMYSLYRINFSAVFDYAMRRRNIRVLIQKLIDIIGLKQVIFGSKSKLVPNITLKKSRLG